MGCPDGAVVLDGRLSDLPNGHAGQLEGGASVGLPVVQPSTLVGQLVEVSVQSGVLALGQAACRLLLMGQLHQFLGLWEHMAWLGLVTGQGWLQVKTEMWKIIYMI